MQTELWQASGEFFLDKQLSKSFSFSLGPNLIKQLATFSMYSSLNLN